MSAKNMADHGASIGGWLLEPTNEVCLFDPNDNTYTFAVLHPGKKHVSGLQVSYDADAYDAMLKKAREVGERGR